jgi:uncharacterized protein
MIEFFNESFEIRQEEKIVIYRFNNGDVSPFVNDSYGANWDLSAKAVKADGKGIYGFSFEHLHCEMSSYLLEGLEACKKNIVFMKCEASKKDIIVANRWELSVSKANIIQLITAEDFTSEFPLYKDIINLYKSPTSPYSDPRKLSEEIYGKALAPQDIRCKWMNSKNDIYMHGFAHSARVERNAQVLAKHYLLREDVRIAMNVFAYYHDLQRDNDGSDTVHGKRASQHLKDVRKVAVHYPSDELFDKLCFACENHTTMLRSGDVFIDICFDADRLDLPRIGTTLDPSRMATRIGAHFAENMDVYRVEFLNLQY